MGISHSPRGGCGLKLGEGAGIANVKKSLPARGVWIEIVKIVNCCGVNKSLPARGVWIEIDVYLQAKRFEKVTPREGGVD